MFSKENTLLWDSVFTTDPLAVKPITGKQYSGNSPKPYWIVEQLTAAFGPCGIGWGFKILNERMERMTDTDILHVAVLQFWYVFEGQRGELEQVGQTKAAYMTSKGSMLIDEDAPKKSVTDALVKCASYLGFAGDIFSGRWDDSKYVKAAGEEWEARRYAKANPKAAERQAELDELALYFIDCDAQQTHMPAIARWYDDATWSADHDIANEEKLYVWGLLKQQSKLRSAIKANKPNTDPKG